MSTQITFGQFEEEASMLSGRHFGSIFRSNFMTHHAIQKGHEKAKFEVGHIRWGNQNDPYNPTGESFLINPGTDSSNKDHLAANMQLATTMDVPFSIVLPSRRYIEEMGQLSAAKSDFTQFLTQLLAGDFGSLPDDLTIELGNESFSVQSNDGQVKYSNYLDAMLGVARNVLADSKINPNGIDFKFSVQTGNGTHIAKQIFNDVSAKNLNLVDSFVLHQLNGSDETLKVDGLVDIKDFWRGKGFGDAEINISSWNVGTPAQWTGGEFRHLHTYTDGPSKLERLLDIPLSELENNDIGARQATGTINVFSQLVGLGVDQMALWGQAKHINSYFWHNNSDDFEKISHGGHAFRLLNESVLGTRILDGAVKQVIEENGDVHGEWSQDHTTNGYDSFVFQDDSKLVVFLTSDDIADAEGLTVTVDTSGFGNFQHAWAEVIGTEVPEHFSVFLTENDIDKSDARYRLFEQPIVKRVPVSIENGSFTYQFQQDYEVARILLAYEEPESSDLHLWGTRKSNTFMGGSGDDFLQGLGGNDSLIGGAGDDVIYGNGGKDRIATSSGNDVAYGGSGDDYFRAGGGAETFIGGKGSDYLSYYDSDAGVTLDLQKNASSGSWASNDVIRSIENVSGSKTGDDYITGTSGANIIRTYGGDDFVISKKGNDLVELGSGDDYVRAGGGKETFFGGEGSDHISYYNSPRGVTIALNKDEVSRSWASNDVILNFENASGSSKGNDRIFGTTDANRLKGHGGNDSLFGRAGDDSLYGGSGADWIDGGRGDDLIFGGSGDDFFVFSRGDDIDVIMDFESDHDTISLINFGLMNDTEALSFAKQVGGSVVFEFGEEDSLTVENSTLLEISSNLEVI